MSGENGVAIYDEATREVLVSSAGSEGIYRATGYSLSSNQWTNWASPWNLYSNIADARVQLRDGSGIGVGAPQFLARRAAYAALTRFF